MAWKVIETAKNLTVKKKTSLKEIQQKKRRPRDAWCISRVFCVEKLKLGSSC